MRRIFLDNLPRLKKDKRSNGLRIDWSNSIGSTINFIYGTISGRLKILKYSPESQMLLVLYNGNRFNIRTGTLQRGALGEILKLHTKDFKIDIDSFFIDKNRDLKIIDREYRKKKHGTSVVSDKWYKYHCNKCGWDEGWILESNLKKGQGCSCCSNRTAVLGINTIWDTDRWMVDLGVSEEDAKKYTAQSNRKIKVKCPDCKKEKIIKISELFNEKSIGCPCGKGFTYPEKFMYSILKQLNINFKTQYSPSYIKPKRSDFFLSDYNLIIETDGIIGHFGGVVHSRSSLKLKELVEIDKWKDEQHLKHGLKTIRINCFQSDMEYIKNNILNSELNDIFDLSKIDWRKCEKFALKNLIKEICFYWNNKKEWETTSDLAKKYDVSSNTIRKYLKKGSKLNWCEYDPKKEILKCMNKASSKTKKEVIMLKDDVLIGVFDSCASLEEKSEELFGVKLLRNNIGMVCRGDRKHHKGYKFKHSRELSEEEKEIFRQRFQKNING